MMHTMDVKVADWVIQLSLTWIRCANSQPTPAPAKNDVLANNQDDLIGCA